MIRSAFRSPTALVSGLALAVAIASAFGGAAGAVGLVLGMAGGAMSFWVLGRVARLMGAAARERPEPKLGAALTFVAFVLKLPVLAGLFWVCFRLGAAASACFMAGVALVYFALLGRVVARG